MGWSRQFIEKVRDATDLTMVAGDFGDTKMRALEKSNLIAHSQITVKNSFMLCAKGIFQMLWLWGGRRHIQIY